VLNRTRRLFVGAVAVFLSLWVFTSPIISFAQTLSDGWIRIGMAASGKWFSVNLRTIEFIGDPRTIVSFMVFEDGSRGHVPWELHCRGQTVKINGIFASIASDGNTVRRIIYNGLCGYQYEGATWTMVGAIQVAGDPTKLNSFMFFDLNSIQSIKSPFSGRSVQALEAVSDNNSFRPIGRSELAFDCSTPVSFAQRMSGVENFTVVEGKFGGNSLAYSTSLLVCADKFFKAENKIAAPKESPGSSREVTPSKALDTAKETCTDLGFKAGSEKFGDCVLRLSK